ncbi:hypothetical protein C8Q74DRAFT_1365993 [Fomes fomentarius]|nr:hypothetical protein C8Q74DRAFT_1365993 [Fomes fomentarius]
MMCDRVLDLIAAKDFASSASSPLHSTTAGGALPEPRNWNITQETQHVIDAAAEAAVKLINSQTLNVVRTPYGKATIKTFGLLPDGWTQMVIQLTYTQLLRKKGLQRQGKFFKGRTEAIRTHGSQAWTMGLLRNALKRHGTDTHAAGNVRRVDRHLLGLKLSVKEGKQLPKVFSHPLVKHSSYWVLSTSAIYSKNFRPYGWGEVVPDGFGVAYVVGFDDFLQFTVTLRTEMPNSEFCEELQHAAGDMYDLLASQSQGVGKAKL